MQYAVVAMKPAKCLSHAIQHPFAKPFSLRHLRSLLTELSPHWRRNEQRCCDPIPAITDRRAAAAAGDGLTTAAGTNSTIYGAQLSSGTY